MIDFVTDTYPDVFIKQAKRGRSAVDVDLWLDLLSMGHLVCTKILENQGY